MRGRGTLGQALVAGAVEITDIGWGRAQLAVIENASATSLEAFITTNVKPGSGVATDAWRSYLPALGDYALVKKRKVDGTYQGSASTEHLQEYLDEFVFRCNRHRPRHRGLVFLRLFQRAVGATPVPYKELVKIQRPKKTRNAGHTGPRSQPGSLETTTRNYPWTTT